GHGPVRVEVGRDAERGKRRLDVQRPPIHGLQPFLAHPLHRRERGTNVRCLDPKLGVFRPRVHVHTLSTEPAALCAFAGPWRANVVAWRETAPNTPRPSSRNDQSRFPAFAFASCCSNTGIICRPCGVSVPACCIVFSASTAVWISATPSSWRFGS